MSIWWREHADHHMGVLLMLYIAKAEAGQNHREETTETAPPGLLPVMRDRHEVTLP